MAWRGVERLVATQSTHKRGKKWWRKGEQLPCLLGSRYLLAHLLLPDHPGYTPPKRVKIGNSNSPNAQVDARRCNVQPKSHHQLHSKLNWWQTVDSINCNNNPEHCMHFPTLIPNWKMKLQGKKNMKVQELCFHGGCKKRGYVPLANSNREGGEVLKFSWTEELA